jgi:hypothetical protein
MMHILLRFHGAKIVYVYPLHQRRENLELTPSAADRLFPAEL